MRGGGALDRVVVNEPRVVYVRMNRDGMDKRYINALAIMTDNNILQTKYIASIAVTIGSPSIGDSVHIVIDNVTKNMGTELNDAKMSKATTITIDPGSNSKSYGTWTSTIVPKNVTVELDCVVVKVNWDVVTAKRDQKITWPESVFNRIPTWAIVSEAYFGYSSDTNHAMFNTRSFKKEGSIPSGWKQYNVDGSGTSLIIGERVTIKELPESFVSHWVNMGAKAYMGDMYSMLVPPE